MGKFKGLNQAEVFGGGSYLPCEDATYKVTVKNAFVLTTRKNEVAAVIEFKVEESSSEKVKVGAFKSQMIMLKHDSAAANIRQFTAAAMGIDPKDDDAPAAVGAQDWDDLGDQLFGDDETESPLKGQEMYLQTFATQTKAKTDFTKHFWVHPDNADSIA
jgi:hypothetical protein